MSFVLIGLAAGLLSGFFGIGGGILIVPALLLVAKMSPVRAAGTSLAALLLPVGALGAWEYYRHGDLDIRAAMLVALGLFLGAWAGAHWASHLPVRLLQRGLSVFLILVAVHLWVTA
jgi:uncharacterized membrane protein YfcA